MLPSGEIFRSVEWVWLLWLGSLAVLVMIHRRAGRGAQRISLLQLHRDESGAAYSLAYVLTMPVYVWFVCMVIETTLVLISKLGTTYAAYAAARCNVVYHSLDPSGAEQRVRRVAVEALVPFASSSRLHADGPTGFASQFDVAEYESAYRRFAPGSHVSSAILRAKYFYADKAVRVQSRKLSSEPNGLLETKVTFEVPLYMPLAGKLLGKRSPWGGSYFVMDISATVQLPDEQPRSADGKLGIQYGPPK